ncbi:glycosyltransferase family 4 protein [Streptomyces tricolor]|nr:glycosyltransferase family 4 protein [Streptomyces tricolor]
MPPRLVHQEMPEARFTLYGPDDGSLPAVRRLIDEGPAGVVCYGGALDPAEAHGAYRSAAVHVLASVNEPFGMTVIEALAAGTPVVCTDTCGIADELARRGAALVTDGSPQGMAAAVRRLLGDPELCAGWRGPAAAAWSRTSTPSAPWRTGWRRSTGAAAGTSGPAGAERTTRRARPTAGPGQEPATPSPAS